MQRKNPPNDRHDGPAGDAEDVGFPDNTAPANANTFYENVRKGERDPRVSDPGPDNEPITLADPDVYDPSPTDRGLPPQFWSSFSITHRRIQEGGWSRQVNITDFPLSKDVAAVNMRLTSGGVRELHWHAADEWALMLTGSCRLSAIDLDGRPYVADVNAGDLWYFPSGIPHSLVGNGRDGCEFLLVFDQADFSEEDTTLISDLVKHIPRDVLAKNWNVSTSAIDAPIAGLPEGGRYIFQTPQPPALEIDQRSAARDVPPTSTPFSFSLSAMKPTYENKAGSVRVVDSGNFTTSRHIAMAYVTVKPGAMRELHWHPNADEWQYYISGKARMTVFFNSSKARTADFAPGDVGAVPKTLPHFVENTGTTDLVFLEMFKADRYQDVSLNDWMTHAPPELVVQHLSIPQSVLDSIPAGNFKLLPR